MSSVAFTITSLYGGAITCDLPIGWRDVSDVRQVPDHQEVYQGPGNEVLVVEILEHHSSVADDASAEYFFDDLAEANQSTGNIFTTQRTMHNNDDPSRPICLCFGIGYQTVTRGSTERVQIELGVIRYASIETDVLVTLSRPEPSASRQTITDDFKRCFSSITVRDWGLFGRT